MRAKISMTVLALFLASCGGSSPKKPSVPSSNSAVGGDNGDSTSGGTDGLGEEGEIIPLEFVPYTGSAMRMVSGKALTTIYSRIFTKTGGYWNHCNVKDQDRNMPLSYCMDSIFAGDERNFVGIFDMRFNSRSNVDRVESISLNYLRSIRSTLAIECKVLVDREWNNLKASKTSANYLIKAQAPKASDLEEFFRKILGVEGTGLKVSINADEYAKAFASSVQDESQGDEKGRRALFEALCIAIASDPQIILY